MAAGNLRAPRLPPGLAAARAIVVASGGKLFIK